MKVAAKQQIKVLQNVIGEIQEMNVIRRMAIKRRSKHRKVMKIIDGNTLNAMTDAIRRLWAAAQRISGGRFFAGTSDFSMEKPLATWRN